LFQLDLGGLFESGQNLPEIKKKKNFSWLLMGTTASSTSPTKTVPQTIGWWRQPTLLLTMGREPTTSRRQEETKGAEL